jgi:septal ring factor EnvC (AmiA/AmiB activator)
VNPDLVVRDKNGGIYTVRYEAVNAMLLNEFLKEHSKNEEREATITQQRKDFEAAIAQQQGKIEALTATVRQQTAQIQKVSAQLAAASPSRGGL